MLQADLKRSELNRRYMTVSCSIYGQIRICARTSLITTIVIITFRTFSKQEHDRSQELENTRLLKQISQLQAAQEELESAFRKLDDENARLNAQLLDKSSQLAVPSSGAHQTAGDCFMSQSSNLQIQSISCARHLALPKVILSCSILIAGLACHSWNEQRQQRSNSRRSPSGLRRESRRWRLSGMLRCTLVPSATSFPFILCIVACTSPKYRLHSHCIIHMYVLAPTLIYIFTQTHTYTHTTHARTHEQLARPPNSW